MAGCGDVLSLDDLQTAKKHQIFEAEVITGKAGGVASGADIDYATNQVTGQTQKTLPAVLRDAGFRPAPFTFETGGTLGVGDSDVAVLWPVSGGGDGQYYLWKGAYPKTIPAASSPASTGGVSDSGWLPLGDITLRNELAVSGGVVLIGNAAIAVPNMALLKNYTWVSAGQTYDLQSYIDIDSGGRGLWRAVLTSVVTPNGIDVVQSIVNPSISFEFITTDGVVDIRQLGARGGYDVMPIINAAMASPKYRVVTASKIAGDAAFICSGTVNLTKSFIGIGNPQFDFASNALMTPSFFTGDTGTTDDAEYSGFEILNSRHVALRGKGDRVLITRIKVVNAYFQGINWQGVQYKITYCYVTGVEKEFGILNGGISRDAEIAFNYVEYVSLGGGIEFGYTASNSSIHHNSIRNCYVGIQVYMHTTGAVDSVLDAIVADNFITLSTLYGIQVYCGQVGGPFTLRGLRIERNNINTAGTSGIYIQGGSTDTLLIDNVVTDIATNPAMIIQSFEGYMEIRGGYIARCNQGIYMQQDGIEVSDIRMYNITYDAFLWTSGNAFAEQSIRGCYLRTIGRDFIRNFNYASYPSINRYNNLYMPLTGASQMNGASVRAGEHYWITNPTPGGAPGFVVTTGGVVGVGAVTKNMPVIAP